ncbi:hypothetical protein SAMN04488498_104325 [Mesorhizobium albiziae]|uniref:DUF4376 domain-containing protein n=1 Tax=Neomesorhizobium albiziae TaxID=335020 RepID=A0A1I3YB07_9HYPH|nr:hypothetical protein [Mesorhizobium albiziae]GLS29970.1 hypothetical protein GCM10007937_16780 [Mesorhizobium albiziae]SFK29137.1 hypothetical protein SAMN04488498_104325 [Mesorhizobium albiziae]
MTVDFSKLITAEQKAAVTRDQMTAAVIAERSRRLAAGFNYDFGDGRGTHRIGTTESDLMGWDEVTKLSGALLATGDTSTTIPVVTDTGPVNVTADDWQQVLLAAGAFRQPIFAASFVLQAMSAIPVNFADDQYWP